MAVNVDLSNLLEKLDSGTTTTISLSETQVAPLSTWDSTRQITDRMSLLFEDSNITTHGRLRYLLHQVNPNQHQRRQQAMCELLRFSQMLSEVILLPIQTANGLRFKTWERRRLMLQDGVSLHPVEHSFSTSTTCRINRTPSSKQEKPR